VFLEWPANYSLSLASVKPAVDSQVILLGHGTVTWHQGSTGVLTLLLPYLPLNCPLQWAWTLKFTNVLWLCGILSSSFVLYAQACMLNSVQLWTALHFLWGILN